jgi:signal transduction histidine kinase/ligand-binding sensor domain-containing protein/DNA-binding response OmpR family regulator
MSLITLIRLMKGKPVQTAFIFFLLACYLPAKVLAQSYAYKFKYLTVDEGLSHTDANDIAQDKYGYIWVATYFGIDRYDGYSIKKYYNNNQPLKNAYKNRIRFIYPDSDGNIWLGTEDGLQYFDPRTESYTDLKETQQQNSRYLRKIVKPAGKLLYGLLGNDLKCYAVKGSELMPQQLKQPRDVRFNDILLAANGLIYFASDKGIWFLDQKNQFKPLSIAGLSEKHVDIVATDHLNNLLATTGNELFLVPLKQDHNKQLYPYKQFNDPHIGQTKDIVQNGTTDYWVNFGKGLIRLDVDFRLIQEVNNKSSDHSLNSNSLTKAIIDRSGCLWLGTFGGGVNYCDLNEKLFYTLKNNPATANSLSGNYVRSVLANGENLWIGTTANGLNLYNLRTRRFTYFNTYNSAVKLKNDVVTALVKDNDQNLWIGSNAGIEILSANRSNLLKLPGADKFPTYVIETLAKDYYGNIWFGNHTHKFGVIYKDKEQVFRVKYYGEGYFIQADANRPQLFVSSTNGLKHLSVDREGNILKTIEYRGGEKPNTLSSDYTYPISKQNDHIYWIGTIGGGLNRLQLAHNKQSLNIKVYNSKNGIFNDVESMEIDDEGNIWMGGNGLECFNPKTGKLTRYYKNDGLQGNSFKVGSSYKGSDGRLYFGGINGLNYFYPKEIKPNTIPAKPILTDILINNQKPEYSKKDSSAYVIGEAIGYGSELEINHLQNNFIIFFSAMHFANPLKCKYRYKLMGFDTEWKFTDGRNPSAAYSNLDFKRYQFIVEATNNDGTWSKLQAKTAILITPPWWKSTLAKAIYILFFISALLAIYIFQARWYRLKGEIALRAVNEGKREEMHKQREELAEQQLMFFTNISHEFRTPLTLILGPLENLIGQNKAAQLDTPYQLMFRNAKRLLNLISELMNFRKIADNIIKLQVQPVMVKQFCTDLAEEFESLANGKQINFTITDHTEEEYHAPVVGFFDLQILEKILFNLLNNAFKYTNEGGTVSFDIFTDIKTFKPAFASGFELPNTRYRADRYIYFRIADSGIGISNESISKIFDRYYRISTEHLGSGVGLALVKSLTELHKGDIYVYSERNKGTEIIIGIPLGEVHYLATEKKQGNAGTENKLEPVDNTILIPLADDETANALSPKKNRHILLVEDNRELRRFLKQTLDKHYHIVEAEDGKSGLDMATQHIPDLIISDVMMPGMNGIEFCKKVKETFETSHIPFIILSAKDALDAKIAGMESGADYYFAKPLSTELLVLTVHNIFEQAEKVKERYTTNYLSEATELVQSEKDKDFIARLLIIIEENIQDQDLDVDFLCNHLFVSRTKLYQKIKSISDQSVAEFIRTVRLKKAIHMMTHEDITIYEVAERIGLQSSSNFSRVFKKEYGKSPMQYIHFLKNRQ